MTVREWFRGMRKLEDVSQYQMLALALDSIRTVDPAYCITALPGLRRWTWSGVELYLYLSDAQRDHAADAWCHELRRATLH